MLVVKLLHLSKTFSLLVIFGGVLVLLGWQFKIAFLKSVLPGYITMKANTALCFLLTGVALRLLQRENRERWAGVIVASIAAFCATLSAITLAEYVLNRNLGIDELLFRDPGAIGYTFPPGRLAPVTATCFLLLSSATLLSLLGERRRFVSAVQAIALFVSLLSFQGLVGYIMGVTDNFGVAFYTQMAIHTAIYFILLGAGFLSLEPKHGFMAVFTGDTAGAITARRLVLAAIFVPTAVSFLQLKGEQFGLYHADLGTLIRVMGNVVFFLIVIWRNAVLLHNIDLKRKTHERALVRSNAELQRFAWLTSHDLKEPLRMVSTYVQLLQRRYGGKLDRDADEFIDFAAEGAKRMHRLIDDILAFSRVQEESFQRGDADVQAAYDEAVKKLAPVIADAGARLNCSRLPKLPADEALLTRLFENLIANAVKFRGAEPPIVDISARFDSGKWIFSVTDNGMGIEPQYYDRIFVMFKRLHTKEAYPGSGVGLAMCKRIVEIHGGEIWVESVPGRGSVFRFSLPSDETV